MTQCEISVLSDYQKQGLGYLVVGLIAEEPVKESRVAHDQLQSGAGHILSLW